MGKHISDSERYTLAILNRKETELKQMQEKYDKAIQELRFMKQWVDELRLINKSLCANINYLVHKDIHHD